MKVERMWRWMLVPAALVAATPAVAQKSANTLRLAAAQPIQTLSYYLDPTPDTVFESNAVYDGLVSYNLQQGKLETLLAKSWQRIDPTTLEFELRDDIQWQDGKPFTAADVIYTLRWLIDPVTMLRFKQNWAWIGGVEQLGPYRARITAKQPTPFDLIRFAYVTTILPEHQPGTPQEKGHKPIGTGPYRAAQIDDIKGIVLERNEGFRHGNPAKPGSAVGRIVIQPIPEEGTRIAQLLAGNLDMIQASYEQASSLAADPRFAMTIVQGSSFMYVAYDAQGRSGAKPVTDERVRRALAMAVDKPALVELLAGDAKLDQPEAMCWRTQAGCDYSMPLPPYDPAAARKLLAEAGYPDGFDVEITTFTGPPSEIAEAVAGQWHAIGVRAKIDRLTVGSYRKKQQDGQYPDHGHGLARRQHPGRLGNSGRLLRRRPGRLFRRRDPASARQGERFGDGSRCAHGDRPQHVRSRDREGLFLPDRAVPDRAGPHQGAGGRPVGPLHAARL